MGTAPGMATEWRGCRGNSDSSDRQVLHPCRIVCFKATLGQRVDDIVSGLCVRRYGDGDTE